MGRRLTHAILCAIGCLGIAVLGAAQTPSQDLVRIDLDKTQLYYGCSPKIKVVQYTCPVGTKIKVSTVTRTPHGRLKYSVTGGRIVGTGRSVIWDLRGLRSGTYTIAVKGGAGSSLSRSITLEECPDCTAECLDCPNLLMSDPTPDPDHLLIYSVKANVTGGAQDTVGLKWSVNGGEIINGQGTSTIWFKIDPLLQSKAITISYRIDGLDPLCSFCPTSMSKAFSISNDGGLQPLPDQLELDKKNVIIQPLPGFRSASGDCEKGSVVDVRSIYSGLTTDHSHYAYQVSGGKIIGTGDRVSWDLSEVKAGRYTISVVLKDSLNNSSTPLTDNVIVSDCPDCICDFTCSSIAVRSQRSNVVAGHRAYFEASVSGGSQDNVKYHWRVSAGRIIRGQGTSSIVVATTEKMAGSEFTATVNLLGLSPEHGRCVTTASGTVWVRSKL